MGWAYAVDLRERVIAAFDAGNMTDEQVAALFKVGRNRDEVTTMIGARTRDALDEAIRRAMDLIGADDASAWFGHCGYGAPLR